MRVSRDVALHCSHAAMATGLPVVDGALVVQDSDSSQTTGGGRRGLGRGFGDVGT